MNNRNIEGDTSLLSGTDMDQNCDENIEKHNSHVKIPIKAGVNVNIQDYPGETALSCVAYWRISSMFGKTIILQIEKWQCGFLLFWPGW